jgi:hypothetical protein
MCLGLIVGAYCEVCGAGECTPDAMADVFGAEARLPARFEALPIDAVGDDDDAQAMFRWFTEPPAYRADFHRTRALVGDVIGSRSAVPRCLPNAAVHPEAASSGRSRANHTGGRGRATRRDDARITMFHARHGR